MRFSHPGIVFVAIRWLAKRPSVRPRGWPSTGPNPCQTQDDDPNPRPRQAQSPQALPFHHSLSRSVVPTATALFIARPVHTREFAVWSQVQTKWEGEKEPFPQWLNAFQVSSSDHPSPPALSPLAHVPCPLSRLVRSPSPAGSGQGPALFSKKDPEMNKLRKAVVGSPFCSGASSAAWNEDRWEPPSLTRRGRLLACPAR
ncbi:hypothetical protein LZ30DRAFT_99207 [Colletotrichum cereale]|nr:hypothetical protein LZ30DRAFT_99207 [Colletotrichum cereale]